MLTDPRRYVRKWLEKKNIVVDERGGLSSPDKRDDLALFDTMFLDYCEQINDFNKIADKKIKGAPETNLRKALDEVISLEMVRRRQEIAAALKCETPNLGALEEFVRAMTGTVESKVVAVLAHFLWTVKRRLNDKEIVYHIMPIIYGKQGGGKSLALHRLFKPLTNLTLELSLTEVTDPRFYFALNRSFVAVLDEMAGAKKTEVESLKKQISAVYNDVRKLNTNTVTKIKQNASFIGTTNRPVSELIFDPTGARRFYEIRALDMLDWGAINSIDYVTLYKGIDENNERGYLETELVAISKDQESLIGVEELAIFLEEQNTTGGTTEISCSVVYELYKAWAEINGIKSPFNSAWFGRKLQNKGIFTTKKKKSGKTVRNYLINEDSELLKKGSDLQPFELKEKQWPTN